MLTPSSAFPGTLEGAGLEVEQLQLRLELALEVFNSFKAALLIHFSIRLS